ncbi:FAD-dependent oxidoreductase, partial [Kitasatospora sp. NPDC058263]
YEDAVRGYAEGCQRGGDRTGPFLAPGTAAGLRLRDGLLGRRWVLNRMLELGRKVSSTIALPDYQTEFATR